MKKYIKNYLLFFDYDECDFIKCEMCNARAVDIHHLVARGIGGTKCDNINEVPNLIALCRSCHIKAENNKEFNKQCKITHLKNMIIKYETE
tara:strand:- start:994 stop:1266 length:273 start_codon:yes stop_codon:yes gene_type:complete